MNAPMIWMVTGLYFFTAVKKLWEGDAASFFLWAAYGIANAALIAKGMA